MSESVGENDSIRKKPRLRVNPSYAGVPTIEYENGRDEKPWQRVLYEMTRKGKHLYEPVKSVPSSLIVVVLGWYLLLGYLTQLVEDGMPKVITESTLARDNSDTFCEETSWKYLDHILGNAPRVGGTAFHYNKTVDMKAMVDDIASQAQQNVRTDWQIVSGDFHIETRAPFVNVYVNVSNVIAVLEGESGFHNNGTIGTSVLVNCHYDSVPFAMGASDNAVFCAVMMEILSKMSKRTQKFKNNIIFLFNGAEELGLLGSHGFLKHPWAHGVNSVVNLDAAGMNGKPSVFQVTDPRLLNAYKRSVYRPSAQGLGELLFSTGIIPSDTDFRIFRDFAGIHGIDIAFTKWAQVYHTRYDHPDLIQTGVQQNAGNMLLALLTELADMGELDTKIDPPSPSVYYDFLNWFMLTYSMSAAYGVDVAYAVLGALSIAYYVWLVGPRWSTVTELVWVCVGRVLAMLAGIALVLLLASIMIATTTQLRYLSEAWIVVPIFWVPYLAGAVAASQAFDAWRTKKSGLNRMIRSEQGACATRLCSLLVLLLLLCIRSMASARYLVSVPLAMMAITAIISITLLRYLRLQAWQHLLLQVVLSTPTVMFISTLALRMNAIMLPIMGRTPSGLPDYTVAFINLLLVVLISLPLSGIELLFSRVRGWLPLSVVVCACAVFMFVPFSPYRDDGPATQRHYWFHSEIVSYDINHQQTEYRTGVSVLKQDAYTHLFLPPLPRRPPLQATCEQRVYCDVPLYRTSYATYLEQSVFMDMGGPAPFSPRASLTSNRTCVGETCTYSFHMIGAPYNTLTIWPRANVNVTSWSLDSPLLASFQQLARPVYTIVYTLATYTQPSASYHFNIICTVPLSLQSGIVLDVSHHSHKIYHPETFTDEYKNLLSIVPKYFNIATFLSHRHNYVF